MGAAIRVTFDAYAAAGRRGLEATVIIEDKNNKNVILNELMDENYHKPGAYTYF